MNKNLCLDISINEDGNISVDHSYSNPNATNIERSIINGFNSVTAKTDTFTQKNNDDILDLIQNISCEDDKDDVNLFDDSSKPDEIIYDYMDTLLDLKDNISHLVDISNNLEKYITKKIEIDPSYEKGSNKNIFIPHILTSIDLIIENIPIIDRDMLGILYNIYRKFGSYERYEGISNTKRKEFMDTYRVVREMERIMNNEITNNGESETLEDENE
jgi:hypothetical protein